MPEAPKISTSSNRVYFLDTTLRDGQQAPGAGMDLDQNLAYAKLAEKMRVDVLEVGFPAAGAVDYKIVNTISKWATSIGSEMMLSALCQLRENQLKTTLEALKPSLEIGKARVHFYFPVSPSIMKASLGPEKFKHKEQFLEQIYRLNKMAVDAGAEVEMGCEGYSGIGQEHFNFALDVIRAAVRAGATVINCSDTTGQSSPHEAEADYIVNNQRKHAEIIAKEFPDRQVQWSIHCHNDIGLALMNSINAVFHGPARQIEGCMNGVGERAGNVALEQCALYLHMFGGKVNAENPFYSNMNLAALKEASDFVASHMLPRQPNWPIVGDNIARHSAGGHTNAILRDNLAYQAFDPALVGSEVTLIFGPLSGGNHAQEITRRHGYVCEDQEKAAMAQYLKDYFCDRRKGVMDDELIQGYQSYRAPIKSFEMLGSRILLNKDQLLDWDQSTPSVTAYADLLRQLNRKFKLSARLRCYDFSISDNFESKGTKLARVKLLSGEQEFTGNGQGRDESEAFAAGLIKAINLAYVERFYRVSNESSGYASSTDSSCSDEDTRNLSADEASLRTLSLAEPQNA